MVWVILILGMIVGGIAGGLRSLRLARQGELFAANRLLRRSATIAGLCGAGLTVPTLGWPFKEVAVSVPGEVWRTIVETVDVPVQVTKWFFWSTTKMERHEVTKEVKEPAVRIETRREFSPLLLIPMAAVGWLCYHLEKWSIQLLWRRFG